MKKETYGFKVGLRTDKQGWRTYEIYQWNWYHNNETIIVSTIAHGSLEDVQSIARDHVKLFEAQQSKRASA